MDARNAPNAFDEFVNPKSMLTPGVTGTVTMTITNSLWVQFGIQPRWCALALSFALGLLVFASSAAMPPWQRMILYVVNSLIIFSVGTGVNYLGGATFDARARATAVSLLHTAPAAYAESIGAVPQDGPTPRPIFPPW